MSASPHLIVGLGNPGPEYRDNRHNVGFMVVDTLARRAGSSVDRQKFKGLFTRVRLGGADCVLLEPQTYMNLSGRSVVAAASFFKIATERLLVIHDELDLEFGTQRLKLGGGLAGHNGLKSIAAELGTRDFARLRLGIGRPPRGSPADWVLSDFRGNEAAELDDVLARAADAVERFLEVGPQAAMNDVNRRDGQNP